jgi:hypothetical protein
MSAWIPASMPILTGIENVNAPSASVYPIPANESVNIWLKNSGSAKVTVALFDITGKVVYENEIENPVAPFPINTTEFPAGLYFYKVYADSKEIQAARLIISH